MAAILNGNELVLTGVVGAYFFEDGFTQTDIMAALADHDDGQPLTMRINSPGGIAVEGAAIRSYLADRDYDIEVVVDGIAASAASLIAMAGKTITMTDGAVLMIHDPSGFTMGTAEDHEKQIKGLNALGDAYAEVYAKRSGKSHKDARAIMKTETWFTGEEAVEAGFADAVAADETAKAVAAFDYRAYANAPKQFVALAAQNNWRLPNHQFQLAAPAADPRPQQENPMTTDKERADKLAAELEVLQATAKADSEALAAEKAKNEDLERCNAIMALAEAEGREDQAKALCDAGVTADAAQKILAAAPKASAAETDPPGRQINGAGLNAGAAGAQPPKRGDTAALSAAVDRVNARL